MSKITAYIKAILLIICLYPSTLVSLTIDEAINLNEMPAEQLVMHLCPSCPITIKKPKIIITAVANNQDAVTSTYTTPPTSDSSKAIIPKMLAQITLHVGMQHQLQLPDKSNVLIRNSNFISYDDKNKQISAISAGKTELYILSDSQDLQIIPVTIAAKSPARTLATIFPDPLLAAIKKLSQDDDSKSIAKHRSVVKKSTMQNIFLQVTDEQTDTQQEAQHNTVVPHVIVKITGSEYKATTNKQGLVGPILLPSNSRLLVTVSDPKKRYANSISEVTVEPHVNRYHIGTHRQLKLDSLFYTSKKQIFSNDDAITCGHLTYPDGSIAANAYIRSDDGNLWLFDRYQQLTNKVSQVGVKGKFCLTDQGSRPVIIDIFDDNKKLSIEVNLYANYYHYQAIVIPRQSHQFSTVTYLRSSAYEHLEDEQIDLSTQKLEDVLLKAGL